MAKFRSNKAQVVAQLYSRQEKALEAAGRIVHGEVTRTLLRGARSGEEYRVPDTKRTYTASAPGEPPAPRTGTLAASYTFQVQPPRVTIGTPLPYARIEYGWGNVSARPHLRPSERKVRDRVIRTVRDKMKL